MKNETVVRQNRCDSEMNLLLFGCFFIFIAMQMLNAGSGQKELVNIVNMALYLVFVPGFFFRLGYCFSRTVSSTEQEEGKRQILISAGRYYIYYFVLAFMQNYLKGERIRYCLSNAITVIDIPAVAAIFFSMALMLVMVWIFYPSVCRLSGKQKKMILIGAVCFLGAFLRTEGDIYALVAAFTGSVKRQAIPIVPYFAYFLLGMWFEEHKPGFQWKMALAAAAVTGISLILYKTPLNNLLRVTASLLPIYLVYVISEGISELTLRFRPVRFVCQAVEPVFWLYTMLLCLIDYAGFVQEPSVKNGLLLAMVLVLVTYGLIVGLIGFSRLYEAAAGFFDTKIKHKTAVYFLIYTVVFAFLLFLTFIDFIRTDTSLLWKNDAISQYYPRAVYYAKIIREMFASLLSGDFELFMYDFRLGFGGEVTFSLEPVYFLFALFGEENVEFTYNLVILLRFYLSGVTASILFRYLKKDYFTTFIASVVYVFCGFSLYGGARHPMFMVPMIMLPLLVIAVEEIIRHKKWYLCTIFVAISLFSNYYYLYMTTLGMVIYFFVRFFCQKEKEKRSLKNFMSYVGITGGSYLLGVAMSCIVLVTTFGLYVGSGRSGGAFIKTPSLFYYKSNWLARCFLSFLTTANSPGDWLKLGFLPIAYLAVVLLFIRKGRKELKVLSVLSVVMMAFPVVGFVFSGFSAVGNRWCYLIALLVAVIVAECLPELYRMDRREMKICLIAVGIYGYLAFLGNVYNSKYTKLAALSLAATFVVVLISQEQVKQISKYMKQCLMVLLTFGMVLISGHTLYGIGGTVKEYVPNGDANRLVTNTALAAMDQVEDETFYRVTTPKLNYWTISSSLVMDYNSTTMFNSTLNGSITEYMEKMGVAGYSVTQLYGLSNRAYLDSLAAVKYYAYYEEPECTIPTGYKEVLRTTVNEKETVVCENQNALPIGYTYDTVISEDELEAYDTVDRQEVMMQTAVVAEKDISDSMKRADTAALLATAEEIEITSKKEEGIVFTEHALTAEHEKDSGMENKVTIYFESKPNSETYLMLDNAFLEGNMSELEIKIRFYTEDNYIKYDFRPDDDRYRSGQEDYIFYLGYYEDAITECTITMDRAGSIEFDDLKIYSVPMDNLETYCDDLREDALENVEIGRNQVSGTISLEKDKLLVLSIPYQNGWSVYVDGQEVKPVRTNYMYIGVPLTAGEHTVELEFAIPGVKYALVIMPSAAVLFIVLWIVSVIRRKKKASVKKDTEEENKAE